MERGFPWAGGSVRTDEVRPMDPTDERLDGGSAWWRLLSACSLDSLVHVKHPRSHSCDLSRARHKPVRSGPPSLPACAMESLHPTEKKLPQPRTRSPTFSPLAVRRCNQDGSLESPQLGEGTSKPNRGWFRVSEGIEGTASSRHRRLLW
eukprot:scaffold770_cov362-Pavlova_lutheri.AAC.7